MVQQEAFSVFWTLWELLCSKTFFPAWVSMFLLAGCSLFGGDKAIPIMEWHLLDPKERFWRAQLSKQKRPCRHFCWKKWEYSPYIPNPEKINLIYDSGGALIETRLGGTSIFSLKILQKLSIRSIEIPICEEWSWYFSKFGFTSFFYQRNYNGRKYTPCIFKFTLHHSI